MRESRSHGSVRGDRGNPVPYRECSGYPGLGMDLTGSPMPTRFLLNRHDPLMSGKSLRWARDENVLVTYS